MSSIIDKIIHKIKSDDAKRGFSEHQITQISRRCAMYIKRFLEEKIIKNSKIYPVIMVCGQRQVGKSTMLHHLMEPE